MSLHGALHRVLRTPTSGSSIGKSIGDPPNMEASERHLAGVAETTLGMVFETHVLNEFGCKP